MQVNIHEAKTRLSALVERVESGEEIIIARAGRPVARLVPILSQRRPRVLGRYAGQPFRLEPDFDTLPPDIQAAFEGS